MDPAMHTSVADAIRAADEAMRLSAAAQGSDPRWQAIIVVGEFIESSPDDVWKFTLRWGNSSEEDLRDAIATILLEHLLEHHFERIFPLVEAAAEADPLFADTFLRCWKFGRSELQENAAKFEDLRRRCGGD